MNSHYKCKTPHTSLPRRSSCGLIRGLLPMAYWFKSEQQQSLCFANWSKNLDAKIGGFYLHNYFHTLLVLDNWVPSATYDPQKDRLMYSVSVNQRCTQLNHQGSWVKLTNEYQNSRELAQLTHWQQLETWIASPAQLFKSGNRWPPTVSERPLSLCEAVRTHKTICVAKICDVVEQVRRPA